MPTEDEIRKWDERFVGAMTLLFSLAAPTLRTLCLYARSPLVLLPAFPYGPLPVLEELVVYHSLDLFLPGGNACQYMWKSNFTFQLPALRRFHIVHDFWSNPSDSCIFSRLAEYNPPNLTHVRISGLSAPQHGFVGDLRRVLGVSHPRPHHGVVQSTSDDGRSSDPQMGTLLPTLDRIIIHGCSPEHSGPCGTPNIEWLCFCIEVGQIVELVKESRGVTVIQLCRPPRRNWRWPERLFDEWVSRIEGGAGCWVESEDEEANLEVYEDDPPLPEMLEWPLPDSDDDL
ncbi:hypothetical protein GSI_01186 [Ganoderma sinense ZZ0214-1]|uniref:Uncharacterized protein n=1 Tax=Ganoderma sinense ZZ0214-1 TaxID=1077348 RepID=A0A2G8SUT8_9APHY|nr:hypothetical protein GSI_01186 [Ganoderma sinense ZZ0214-1]